VNVAHLSGLAVGALVFLPGSTIARELPQETSPATVRLAQVGPEGRRERGRRLFEALDLSSEQQQELRAIRTKYQPEMQSLRDDLRREENELRSLMIGSASDAEIRAHHEHVVQLRNELGGIHFESMLEMRQVLTSAQRQELGQLLEERRNERGPRGRRGGFRR